MPISTKRAVRVLFGLCVLTLPSCVTGMMWEVVRVEEGEWVMKGTEAEPPVADEEPWSALDVGWRVAATPLTLGLDAVVLTGAPWLLWHAVR